MLLLLLLKCRLKSILQQHVEKSVQLITNDSDSLWLIYFINRMHLFHIWNLFYILNRLRRSTFKCITTLYWFCIHKYKNMKNIQKYVACWTWIILNSIEYSDYRFNLDFTLSANQSKTNSCDVLHFINANKSNFNVNLINKR